MAKQVHNGFRFVTPGKCFDCGDTDGWDCDGRNTIFCSCQCCPECGEFDGHAAGCPVLEEEQEELELVEVEAWE